MPTLVCLGLGYCARHYVTEFGARFERIIGTTRTAQRAAALGREQFGGRPVEVTPFDGVGPHELAQRSRRPTLLISAAPADGRDPVLAVLAERSAGAALSSLSSVNA